MAEGETLADTRGAQMFLRFNDAEIERLSRFGQPRSYKKGEMLARIGEPGPGMMLILSGRVEVTQPNGVRSRSSPFMSAAISWVNSPSFPVGRTSSTKKR